MDESSIFVSIAYWVPVAGTVSIQVIDIQGRVIRELRSTAARGGHTEIWDGRNSAGERAATGVYLVRVTSPSQTTTTRIVLAH